MKKTLILSLVAASLVLGTSMASIAQQQGGGPRGGGRGPEMGGPRGGQRGPGGGMMLIQMSTVQKELKLTSAQLQAIQDLRPPQDGGGPRGGGREGGGPGAGGPGEPGKGPLDEILSNEQHNRLQQLVMQFNAPMSMLDPRVAEQLNLTDSQVQTIESLVQDLRPGRGPGQGGPRGGGQGQGQGQGGERPDWNTMQAKKAAAYEKAWNALSQAQQAEWGKIVGKAFTAWEEPTRPR